MNIHEAMDAYRDPAEARRVRGEPKLTDPQARMLVETVETGEKRLNGRARRTVEALTAAGLVEFDYDLVPHVGKWSELFIVHPTDAGRALAAKLDPPPAPPTARQARAAMRRRHNAELAELRTKGTSK